MAVRKANVSRCFYAVKHSATDGGLSAHGHGTICALGESHRLTYYDVKRREPSKPPSEIFSPPFGRGLFSRGRRIESRFALQGRVRANATWLKFGCTIP